MSSPVEGSAATAALIGGRNLAKNTAWNLFGQVAPLGIGIVTIPILVRHLGLERFGNVELVSPAASSRYLSSEPCMPALKLPVTSGQHAMTLELQPWAAISGNLDWMNSPSCSTF